MHEIQYLRPETIVNFGLVANRKTSASSGVSVNIGSFGFPVDSLSFSNLSLTAYVELNNRFKQGSESSVTILDGSGDLYGHKKLFYNIAGTDRSLINEQLGTQDDQTASEVPFTPAGTVIATDVQAAIEELDSDIQGIQHPATDLGYAAGLTNGTVTSSTGTDATIPLVDTVANTSGLMSPGDKTKLDGIETNAKDDQTASEVPLTPSGNVSSINVQSAIEELDLEKVQLTNTDIHISLNPGDDIQSAIDSLQDYIFVGTARGYVDLSPGSYILTSPLVNSHIQGEKVILSGTNPGQLDYLVNFTGVKATDLSVAEGHFQVIIDVQSSQFFYSDSTTRGIQCHNLLIKKSGTQSGSCFFINGNQTSLVLSNNCIFGFSVGVDSRENSFAFISNTGICYCFIGLQCIQNAQVSFRGPSSTQKGLCAILYSDNSAVFCSSSYIVANYGTCKNSGAYGFSLTKGSSGSLYDFDILFSTYNGITMSDSCYLDVTLGNISDSSIGGASCYRGSFLRLDRTVFSNNPSYAVRFSYGSNGSYISNINVSGPGGSTTCISEKNTYASQFGTNTGAVFSPPVGVLGNDNSKWD